MTDRSARFDSKTLLAFSATGLPEVLAVKAATSDQPAEILLYDEIGDHGVSAKQFATALAKAGPGKVNVHINSPGGNAFEGVAIYSMLRNHKGGVETTIDGLAASAASIVAMAGDRVSAQELASIMIHCAHGIVLGNRHDMQTMQAHLQSMDEKMAHIYAQKTGLSKTDIHSMMDKETWFTSTSAKDSKFIDAVIIPERRDELGARLDDAMILRASGENNAAGDVQKVEQDAEGDQPEPVAPDPEIVSAEAPNVEKTEVDPAEIEAAMHQRLKMLQALQDD